MEGEDSEITNPEVPPGAVADGENVPSRTTSKGPLLKGSTTKPMEQMEREVTVT